MTMGLRSVHGAIFYLGEVLRYQHVENKNKVLKVRVYTSANKDCKLLPDGCPDERILFHVVQKKLPMHRLDQETPEGEPRGTLRVKYKGAYFTVPKREDAVSDTVLALLSQLTSLLGSSVTVRGDALLHQEQFDVEGGQA